MKGLARGSGLTYQQVLVMQTFLDIKKLVQCSTIAVQPSRSADGTPMLARNLDFPSLGIAHRFSLVILRQPKNGTKTATVGWPGLLGTLSGMNEHGLSLAMMEVYDRKSQLKGTPYPLVYRAALEGSKTVDEVEDRLKEASRTTSNNLTVADAQGGAAVFEVDVEDVHRRAPDRGVVFSTNHFVSPGFRQNNSCARFRKLQAYFADGKNRVRAKDLEGVLDQVDQGQLNLQAMIFLPVQRSIGVSLGKVPAAKGPYTYLNRDQLFP
jgi:predicted choloylglycine hydrolase